MRISAAVAIAGTALFLTGVGGAADFTDPVGDTYGPDINKVSISERPGFLDVQIAFLNHPELEKGEIVQVDVDTDANEQTGDGGIDLYGVLEGTEDANERPFVDSEVLKYDKSIDDYVDITVSTIAFDDEGAKLSVPLSLVGRSVKVTVSAYAAPLPPPPDPTLPPPPPKEPDTDNAPDSGAYTFALATPTLSRATVSYAPALPQAGKTFKVQRVSLVLSSGGPFAAQAACTATLNGKKLAPAGPCSWRLPKSAKRKLLRVNVSATFAGTTFKLPARSFRVR
jgi:hypothetical protein